MSKVKIQGNASGTGVLTVTAPNTSTDRTITLPDSTGTLVDNTTAVTKDASGNVGIGVTPESWNSSLTALQIGETGAISGGDTGWGGYLEIGSNFYRDSGGFKYTTADKAVLTEYDNSNGRINHKVAASGSADAAITLLTRGTFDADGLKFNGDTAAANALDDYEEGYYTVSISGSTSGSFNMAGNDTLAYTKIGRLVTIQGYIGAQSGSVSGNVKMSLPFAPTNLGVDDQTYNFPSLMIQNTGNTISGQKYLFLQADGFAYLYKVADDGSAGYISNSSVDGNFELGVSFTYISG